MSTLTRMSRLIQLIPHIMMMTIMMIIATGTPVTGDISTVITRLCIWVIILLTLITAFIVGIHSGVTVTIIIPSTILIIRGMGMVMGIIRRAIILPAINTEVIPIRELETTTAEDRQESPAAAAAVDLRDHILQKTVAVKAMKSILQDPEFPAAQVAMLPE